MKKAVSKEEYDRRHREDFDFMVLCEAKGNRGMYRLLRDTELDDLIVADEAPAQERLAHDGG